MQCSEWSEISSTQHAHDEHKTAYVPLPSLKQARVDHFKPRWVSKVLVNCIVSDTFIGFALMQVSLPHYSGQVAKSNVGITPFTDISLPTISTCGRRFEQKITLQTTHRQSIKFAGNKAHCGNTTVSCTNPKMI